MKTLTRSLTLRYLAGLLMIAAVLIATYAVLVNRMKQNEDTAYIVNIAGMQRMLSQRIALGAQRLISVNSKEARDDAVEMIMTAAQRMQTNHRVLYERAIGEEGSLDELLLYQGGLSVHDKVERYTDAAKSLVRGYRQLGLEGLQQSDAWRTVFATLDDGLLEDLNTVVSQIEADANREVKRFIQLEKFFLGVGLLVLLLEVLLIFRPMVRQVETTLGELEVANDELRQFSFRISHDLRAPIASSLGLIRIAAESLQEQETHVTKNVIGRIEKSMQQLDSLIECILQITRNKQVVSDLAPVDVQQLVETTLEKLAHMPNADKVSIRINLDSSVNPATDPMLMQQILENLISNGIKYFDPAEHESYVEIVGGANAVGQYEIKITDNGRGIPARHQDDVFGMFKRFHPKVSFGSGLGLYLVKQNANAIGASIDYTPTINGSQFRLRLPISGEI